MGFFDSLLNRMEKKLLEQLSEDKARKYGIDAAKTMMSVALRKTAMFAEALKPYEFARAAISGRPNWSQGHGYTLLYNGIDTGFRMVEGINISDVIGFVVTKELNQRIPEGTPRRFEFISTAADAARQHTIENLNPHFLRKDSNIVSKNEKAIGRLVSELPAVCIWWHKLCVDAIKKEFVLSVNEIEYEVSPELLRIIKAYSIIFIGIQIGAEGYISNTSMIDFATTFTKKVFEEDDQGKIVFKEYSKFVRQPLALSSKLGKEVAAAILYESHDEDYAEFIEIKAMYLQAKLKILICSIFDDTDGLAGIIHSIHPDFPEYDELKAMIRKEIEALR